MSGSSSCLHDRQNKCDSGNCGGRGSGKMRQVAATVAAAMAVAAAQPATFDAQYRGFSNAIVKKCIQFASYITRIS